MTSTSEIDWESLPEELWLIHVFKYLPPRTLSRVALVSKKMKRVATDPLLWASKEINLNKAKIIGERPFLSFLSIPRFTKIKSLDLSGQELSLQFAESLLRYINSNHCQILSNLNLSNVEVGKGINTPCRKFFYNNSNFVLHHFDFVNENSSFSVSTHENVVLFGSMMITDVQIFDARSLNENLLGRAIAKLDESKLAEFVNAMPVFGQEPAGRPSRFVAAILRKVKTTLHHQSIDFSCLDFTQVSPTLFAEAVASLRRVKLIDCIGLTSDHITKLFAFIAKQESVSLTSVILCGKNLAGNPPGELARSVSKLKHLHLRWLHMDQVQAILEAVPKSNLQSLDIGMPSPTGVPIEIIRKAILHLNPGKKVTIPSRCVTREDKFAIWKLLCGNDVFFW